MGRPRKDSATKPVQERLEDAMIKRMLDEPVGAVSVRELTEDTACNRSTFYYYFNDIDEIANAALDRAIPYELPLTIDVDRNDLTSSSSSMRKSIRSRSTCSAYCSTDRMAPWWSAR